MSVHDKASEVSALKNTQGEVVKRRPYRAPELRSLGSVREVTWGGGSLNEGGFTGMGMGMGM